MAHAPRRSGPLVFLNGEVKFLHFFVRQTRGWRATRNAFVGTKDTPWREECKDNADHTRATLRGTKTTSEG